MNREQLRAYLIGRIDNILTGFLTARLLSDQDKNILSAERALYVSDDGTVLDRLLHLMAPGREAK